MDVIEVTAGSKELDAVVKLWRCESDTLGLMPRGGFSDAARARCLLAAKDSDGTIVGYVFFRRSMRQGRVSITHLCVARNARGRGIADALFLALKNRCADCFDVVLKCRRDFERANRLWQRLGFTALGDERGRGRESRLTTWRYPLAELPLLRRAYAEQQEDDRILAVIDANVFFDLDESVAGNDESRALAADWLAEFVELQVTEELLNEINRCESQPDRERQRLRVAEYQAVRRDTSREEPFVKAIQAILPSANSNQLSDVRQLAMAAAADVPFFVTRDEDFLNVADALRQQTQVRIVRPLELVLRFDELRREEEYRPERLFLGQQVTSSLARPEDVESIADLMHDGQPPPEKLGRTRARLRSFLAAPAQFVVQCIRSGDELLAAYVLERTEGVMRVPFFGVQHSSLGRTAARHWGDAIVAKAVREQCRVIRVEPAGRRIEEALDDLGFERDERGWIKIGIQVTADAKAVADAVDAVGLSTPDAAAVAARLASELRKISSNAVPLTRVAASERALWPAKVLDAGLPCFIVPIRPKWAKDLFDLELARGTLFGADPSVVLNCENVYYRSASPAILTAPSRVLWYVSQDRSYPQAKSIRACSQIDEVSIGPAKDLFRRFRRFGIYTWRQVLAMVDGDPERDIMAFRFSKTELFRRPISWQDLQRLLRTERGKGNTLTSPIKIAESFFAEVYGLGAVDAP